jgi:hypothetical protein
MLCLVALVASSGEHRVLVMDLEAVGVPPIEASAATRVITAAASEVDGLTIMSTADLRRMADLEANKFAAGCTDDTNCVAEIAGALGAEQVLYGSLSRLGSTTTVSLSLYTSATHDVVRRSVDVKNVDDLAPQLREKTTELLRATLTTSPTPAGDAAGADDSGPSAGFVTVVAGATVGVLGAAVAGVSEFVIQDATGDGQQKSTFQTVGIVGLAGVGVGATVAAAGLALMVIGGE